ncbi:MAG: hypothetical protein ACRBCK_03965 [Alphaproteobacteria bacterium]
MLKKLSSLRQKFSATDAWEDAGIAYKHAQQGEVIDPKTMKVSSTFDPHTDEGMAIIEAAKEHLDTADKAMENLFLPE